MSVVWYPLSSGVLPLLREMSTSLIEERIAEMTNPRAMNIHFPSPGGPSSSSVARGPESSTTPFPELAEKYDHDHGEVATDIGSERGQSGAAVEGGGVQVDKKGSSDRLGSTVASLSPEYLALRAKTRLEETRRREQEPSLSKQMDSHPSTARTPASTAGNKLVASRVLQEAVQREASSQGTLITSRDHMNSLQSKSNDDDGTNTDPGQWSDMTSPMGRCRELNTPKNAVASNALCRARCAVSTPSPCRRVCFTLSRRPCGQ